MPSAGDYFKPVIVQKPIREDNALGDRNIVRYAYVADWWCTFESISGRELAIARQNQMQISHRLRGRWFDGFKSDMRITWQEDDGRVRILEIKAIRDPEEKHLEWIVDCLERTSG